MAAFGFALVDSGSLAVYGVFDAFAPNCGVRMDRCRAGWRGLRWEFFAKTQYFADFAIVPGMGPFVLALAGTCCDLLFFRPAAYVLRHAFNERLIKTTSVFLLLVGFHFDLLTS